MTDKIRTFKSNPEVEEKLAQEKQAHICASISNIIRALILGKPIEEKK